MITIQAIVNSPIEKVWKVWTSPEHITKWNSASDDWHTPKAENDLRVGGKFLSRMEAKDGSMGFDFIGTYDAVEQGKLISYVMEDGRKCKTTFTANGNETEITTSFDAETQNSEELQRAGWQAILNSFKLYCEGI